MPAKNPITRWLPVGNLVIPEEYQRDFSLAKGRKLSAEWDDAVVGELFVSERADGSLNLIEGQHRRWAAEDRFGPNKKLKCAVYMGLSVQDEADMFVKLNTMRTSPTAFDRARASVAAGYALESEIADVLNSLDLRWGKSAGPNTIGAITALRRIMKTNGGEQLRQTLEIVIATWGRKASTYDADIIQAVARLLFAKPDLDTARLVKVLAKDGREPQGPNDWKRKGGELARGGSASRSGTIARLMGVTYDRNLPAGKKIDIPWA